MSLDNLIFSVIIEETEQIGLCHLETTDEEGQKYRTYQITFKEIERAIDSFLYSDDKYQEYWTRY